MQGKMKDINRKELKNKFFKYVIPSVAAMWVYTIYTMVDGMFVARGVSKDALAAVNISMPMINVAFAVGILFAVGASTRASICKGRGEYDKANMIFTLSSITVAVIGLLVMLTVKLNITWFAQFLGATDETIEYVKDYLGVIIMFVPFYMTSYNLEVLIKADGFPTRAIKTSVLCAVTNIVLDAVFVLAFHWGVAGAAFATGLSQVIGFVVFMRHFLSSRSGFSFVKIRWRLKDALSLAKLGTADFITEISVAVCIFVFNQVLLRVSGNDGIVIYTVISYFSQIVLMTMIGMNQGTQPIMSYHYGRGERAAYRYIFRIALICAAIGSLVAFAIGTVIPDPIVAIYIDKTADAALFERGVEAFRLYSLAFLPLGMVTTLMGYFTSIEVPQFAMSISVSRGLIFVGIFVIVLAMLFGEKGVWLATAASEFCTLMLALVLYRRLEKGHRPDA